MDKYETRDMSGSAFKNKNRRTENDSNYSGTVKIEGKEYWINVWVKKTKDGDPWFSYSFREKKPIASIDEKPSIEIDDNIPF